MRISDWSSDVCSSDLPNHVYHLTVTTQGRTPFFDDFAAACAAAACFEDPVLLGDSRMLAWVLMPDHAHWLLQLGESAGLIATVSRLKSASSRAANKTLGRNGHLDRTSVVEGKSVSVRLDLGGCRIL